MGRQSDENSDKEYMDYVVLEEIDDNSDEDETTDTAQLSEKDEDDSEGDNDSEDNTGYDDDDDEDDDNNEDSGGSVSDAVNEGNYDDNSEEVQVTFCVLPNLVEHAGHGKDDIFIIDSFKQG